MRLSSALMIFCSCFLVLSCGDKGGNAPIGSVSGCTNGGASVGGACWFLGAAGANCDTACGTKLVDAATQSFAGSSGTNTNCQSVLSALGAATTPFVASFSSGLGCFFHIGVGASRDTATTLNGVTLANVQRACACD